MSALAEERAGWLTYHRGIALVVLAGALWSTVGIGVRLIEDASAWQILFYRSASLAVFLFAVFFVRNPQRPFDVMARAGLPAILGGISLVGAFVGSIVAIINTTVANAMFLFAAAPFIVAVLSWLLLRERVRKATWIGVVFAIAGIGIMVADAVSAGQFWGNAAAVLSAFGFAGVTMALRWGRMNDMLPLIFYGALFTSVITAVICSVNGEGLAVSTWDGAVASALGVIVLGCGLSVYSFGARVVPAAELSLLAMTEVLLGPLWVWLFLGETAGLLTWMGGAVLLSAIAGNALSGLRRAPPPSGIH